MGMSRLWSRLHRLLEPWQSLIRFGASA